MKKFLKIFFLSLLALVVLFATHFLIIRKLDNNAVEEKAVVYLAPAGDQKPVSLPSLFLKGQRFYIKMRAANGDTLLAFGDSGGGITMTFPDVVDKLGLHASMAILKGIMPMKYIAFASVVKDDHMPPPMQPSGMILRTPYSKVDGPFLLIPPIDDDVKFLVKYMKCGLFLGQNFFMGKAWTFDYINKQVWLNTPIADSDEHKPGVQKISFKQNEKHENIEGHGAMYIEVDGEIIAVLFDTGATIVLSKDGKKAFNTTDQTIGGSFIAASIFDGWRKKHPDWKYYPKADMDRDIIEVPKIKICGQEVGPVLFARRPDEVWSKGMIYTMDRVVKGAIGGSALQYFKVTIDYNSGLVRFNK